MHIDKQANNKKTVYGLQYKQICVSINNAQI